MAAASTTPTPRIPSRTRPRGPTGSRSSCSWLIPFSLPRTFGRMVGNTKQGLSIAAVMAGIFLASLAINVRLPDWLIRERVPTAVGAASEGTEARFGVPSRQCSRPRRR